MTITVGKYREWCAEAGWEPSPDNIVYRGGICLGETDADAHKLRDRVEAAGGGSGTFIGRSLSQAVQSARSAGQTTAATPRARTGGTIRMLNFVGSPDTVAEQLREYHDKCGVGVVDLAFQQPGLTHQDVITEIELFGKKVLPQIREF